jgi:hypothetical protein
MHQKRVIAGYRATSGTHHEVDGNATDRVSAGILHYY